MALAGEPKTNEVRFGSRDWLILAICWLGLTTYYLVFAHVHDVDDTVRLIQVRAWLAGQSWFDLTQYRIAPPGGVAMHWSRLVDLPIAAAILGAGLFVGRAQAEAFAMAAVPLATMGCVAILIYRATLRLTPRRAEAILAVILGCITSSVFGQLNPGRIDHHGWQVVAALGALNGLLAPKPRAGGILIGAGLALWLAISIEGLPVTAAFLAVLGLRWLHDRSDRDRMLWAALSLAAVSSLLWLATHRLDGSAFAPWCDVVTPVHLAMFAWTALGIAVTVALPAGNRLRDAGLLALVALGGLAIFALGAPQCVRGGGYNQLEPLVVRYWLSNVGEAMPVWHMPLVSAASMALPAVLGLVVLTARAWRERPNVSPRLWSYSLILIAATAVGCAVIRAFAVATALAAPAFAWGLLVWLRATSAEERGRVRAVRWALLIAAISPWVLQLASDGLVLQTRRQPEAECDLVSHSAALGALPAGTFLAPFDLGPDLLLGTHHSILASGHHRGAEAMRDELVVLLGGQDVARRIIARRRIRYVALCPDSAEVDKYKRTAPNGFVAQLTSRKAPPWLAPIPISGQKAPLVWRVDLSPQR